MTPALKTSTCPASTQIDSATFLPAQDKLKSYLELGTCIALLLLPMRLSLTYVVLLPCLALWICAHYKNFSAQLRRDSTIATPFICFLLAAFASSAFGLTPLRSMLTLASLAFYSISFFLFRDLILARGPLLALACLLIGHALPALYAIINAALGEPWGSLFHGKVTQSGQLNLSLTLAIALAFGIAKFGSKLGQSQQLRSTTAGAGLFCCLFLLAFSNPVGLSPGISALLLLPILGFLLLALQSIRNAPKDFSDRFWIALVALLLPLMATTLMINLKRGPWLGTTIALVVFFFMYARRLLFPTLIVLCVGALSIAPIRTRLAQSTADFSVPGGRSIIWRIGEDLMTRYPLGIGFKNSAFLQRFSSEIPTELTHFHNNFLNIVVETGWLAFPIFLYWLLVLYQRGLQLRSNSLQGAIAVGSACALLAWQVAGIVEYNFGDSEVLLLAFFCVALLSAASLSKAPGTQDSSK